MKPSALPGASAAGGEVPDGALAATVAPGAEGVACAPPAGVLDPEVAAPVAAFGADGEAAFGSAFVSDLGSALGSTIGAGKSTLASLFASTLGSAFASALGSLLLSAFA